jgi:hypothetical protein
LGFNASMAPFLYVDRKYGNAPLARLPGRGDGDIISQPDQIERTRLTLPGEACKNGL